MQRLCGLFDVLNDDESPILWVRSEEHNGELIRVRVRAPNQLPSGRHYLNGSLGFVPTGRQAGLELYSRDRSFTGPQAELPTATFTFIGLVRDCQGTTPGRYQFNLMMDPNQHWHVIVQASDRICRSELLVTAPICHITASYSFTSNKHTGEYAYHFSASAIEVLFQGAFFATPGMGAIFARIPTLFALPRELYYRSPSAPPRAGEGHRLPATPESGSSRNRALLPGRLPEHPRPEVQQVNGPEVQQVNAHPVPMQAAPHEDNAVLMTLEDRAPASQNT